MSNMSIASIIVTVVGILFVIGACVVSALMRARLDVSEASMDWKLAAQGREKAYADKALLLKIIREHAANIEQHRATLLLVADKQECAVNHLKDTLARFAGTPGLDS